MKCICTVCSTGTLIKEVKFVMEFTVTVRSIAVLCISVLNLFKKESKTTTMINKEFRVDVSLIDMDFRELGVHGLFCCSRA